VFALLFLVACAIGGCPYNVTSAALSDDSARCAISEAFP